MTFLIVRLNLDLMFKAGEERVACLIHINITVTTTHPILLPRLPFDIITYILDVRGKNRILGKCPPQVVMVVIPAYDVFNRVEKPVQ